jgi:hypothetical protein
MKTQEKSLSARAGFHRAESWLASLIFIFDLGQNLFFTNKKIGDLVSGVCSKESFIYSAVFLIRQKSISSITNTQILSTKTSSRA